MRLEIRDAWSMDLDPPSSGSPPDQTDFDIHVQFLLGEVGQSGSECFDLRVCSSPRLAESRHGEFVRALVLDRFDWRVLQERIEKLLRSCQGSTDWNEVVDELAPFLRHTDRQS